MHIHMAPSPLALLLLLLCLSPLRAGHRRRRRRVGAVGIRPSPAEGSPLLVVLQEPADAEGVDAGDAVAHRPLAAGRPGRIGRRGRHLIFVDNPVGVGYSYSEDPSALVTTDRQAAADATALLKALAGEVPGLPSSPLFLVGESYGGKFAATLGVSVAEAIRSGDLKLTLGGVALGDSWISPGDFAVSYAPLLLSVSRLDDNAGDVVKKEAETVKEQVAAGQLPAAQKTWTDLLDLIDSKGASVDVYNFMRDSGMEPVLTASNAHATKYSTYLGRREAEIGSNSNSIDGIMNGAIKKKLKIIPKDLKWQEASIAAFNALLNEFMKPRISEVDQLLSYGVNVTVYNGQLDVICSTMGAEEWVKKLKWDGLNNFLSLPRQPLH